MTRIVWAGGPPESVGEGVARSRRRRRGAKGISREEAERRSVLRSLLLIMALAGVALVGVSLRISEVRVNGAVMADLDALRGRLEPVLGERLLLVDTKAVRHRLEEDAWIHSVSVSRRLPGRLEVRIEEGQPLYRLPEARGLVDADGNVLPLRSQVVAGALPVLQGAGWANEGALSADTVDILRELSKALQRVAWTWTAGLAGVRLPGADGVELIAADGLRLILGDTDFERRLSRFAAVQPRLGLVEGRRVDLRFERRVVLAPGGLRAEPTGG